MNSNWAANWISVKDRLPKGEPIWTHVQNPGASLRGIELWREDSYSPQSFPRLGVTHWMPATLPEPPKSEVESDFAKWIGNISTDKPTGLRAAFLAGWQACEKRGEG